LSFLPSYRISADRVVPVAVPGLSITTTYEVFRSIEILRRADVSLIDTGHIHHINYFTFNMHFKNSMPKKKESRSVSNQSFLSPTGDESLDNDRLMDGFYTKGWLLSNCIGTWLACLCDG
jgi:hypothetical protein